jgi:signal transduction histidine kinase
LEEKKILIVDDDPSIRSLLGHFLQEEYSVQQAESGTEAIRALSNGFCNCDLILMDQMMPEMDGMHSFQAIHESHPFLPVIMLTGYSSLHLGVEFMKIGGTDFLEKPVDRDLLRIKISRALTESESKRRFHEAEIENKSLEKSNDAKIRFIAVMGHELRTPLNSIIGYSQMLQRIKNLNSDARLYSDNIVNAGNHLADLINDLLDISRIESGAIALNMIPVAIEDVAIQIKEYLSGINSHGLNIKVNVKPMQVMIDRKRLLQILINLTTNAIKYTNKGSVTIAFERERDYVRISVSDTGCGISEDRIPSLFKMDEQLLAGDRYDGLGIGLAISYELTKLMGSELTVETELNKGSVFSFYLPAGE